MFCMCKHALNGIRQRQTSLVYERGNSVNWGVMLLIPQTHKYRSKSELHICDLFWSLNLWNMCYLHLRCHFYSASDIPELSAPETGLGHFRNHIWVDCLVNAGRTKPPWAPDLYITCNAHPAAVEGTEGEKSYHCYMCHRTEEAVPW